jgi:hypothetical protein
MKKQMREHEGCLHKTTSNVIALSFSFFYSTQWDRWDVSRETNNVESIGVMATIVVQSTDQPLLERIAWEEDGAIVWKGAAVFNPQIGHWAVSREVTDSSFNGCSMCRCLWSNNSA